MVLRRLISASLLLVPVCAAGAFGCTANTSDPNPDHLLPENTGAVSARLESVPSDVQCIEIHTTDYRTPYVAINVVPGQSANIRIAPLSVGWVGISGVAYNRPCYGYGYGTSGGSTGSWPEAVDGGSTPPPYPGADAGIGYPYDSGTVDYTPTWEASQIYVNVQAGTTVPGHLVFRQPGGVDLTIDFDNCAGDDGGFSTCPQKDGGPDDDGGPYPWPVYDAGPGPFPAVDASAPRP